MKQIEKQRISLFIPFLGAFISSAIMSIVVILSVLGYGTGYDSQIIICVLLLLGLWSVGLILSMRHRPEAQNTKKEKFCFLLLFALLAFFYVYISWIVGYLRLDIFAAIQNGAVHRDTFFHSSIAQALKYYGYPSFLINSDAFYNYHFGSHLIFSIISSVSNVPILFLYVYLYPLAFLPLYIFLILAVPTYFRAYLAKDPTLKIPDIILILCFIIGFVPVDLYNNRSFIISESYMVALCMAMIYMFILFASRRRNLFHSRLYSFFFFTFITPFFIIATAASKISVGAFLIFGVCYYLVRMHPKRINCWLISLSYAILFAAFYLFPSTIPSTFSSNTEFSHIVFLHFWKYAVPIVRWPTYFFIAFFFTLVELYYRLRNATGIVPTIKTKEYISEEILLLLSVIGLLPGLLFEIYGASAFYFSSIQQLIAILLLLGYNIPNEIVDRIKKKHRKTDKFAIRGLVILLIATFLLNFGFTSALNSQLLARFYNSKYYDKYTGPSIRSALQEKRFGDAVAIFASVYLGPSKYGDSSIVQNTRKINEITKDNKKEYYLFLDETAEVWKDTRHNYYGMFYYPATTGVVTIGSLYGKDGSSYYGNGAPYDWLFFKPGEKDIKLSLEEAIIRTQEDGRKYLIHLHDDSYTIIDVSDNYNQ